MDFPSSKLGILLHDRDQGGVGGAISLSKDRKPSKDGTVVYLNCGNHLDAVLHKIESAGVQILQPKTDMGGNLGFFALFLDSEGNIVGLFGAS